MIESPPMEVGVVAQGIFATLVLPNSNGLNFIHFIVTGPNNSLPLPAYINLPNFSPDNSKPTKNIAYTHDDSFIQDQISKEKFINITVHFLTLIQLINEGNSLWILMEWCG